MTEDPPRKKAFDKTSVHDWIAVLHNAARVKPDDPRYADAQDVIDQSLEQIAHIQRQANFADQNAAEPGRASKFASATLPAMNSLALGTPELLAGAGSAMTGGTFREGAQNYRSGLENLNVSNPEIAAASDLAGNILPSLIPGRAAAGMAIRAGETSALARGAVGAGKGAAAGGLLGGVSGFSSGGEDPGDVRQRLADAWKSGLAGAVVGGALGGVTTGGAQAWKNWRGKGAVRRARMQAGLEKYGIDPVTLKRSAPVTPEPDITFTGPGGRTMTVTAEEARQLANMPEPAYQPSGRTPGPSADLPGRPAGRAPWETSQANVVEPSPSPYGSRTYSSEDPAVRAAYAPRPNEVTGGPSAITRAEPPVSQEPSPMPTRAEIEAARNHPRPPSYRVEPGPYQKAAPNTRRQNGVYPPDFSTPEITPDERKNMLNAILLSGDHPEVLTVLPEDFLQNQLGFGRSGLSNLDPKIMQNIEAELAKRGASGPSPFDLLKNERGTVGPVRHASPYKFDQFNNTKIGTGQGAQSYGHGHYVAENPVTTDEYLKEFASRADNGKGYLYDAMLKAEPDEFLHWDKPLSEQSDKVKAIVARLAPDAKPNFSGEDIYRRLTSTKIGELRDAGASRPVPEGEAASTEALRKAGIKGIKYLDQGSRHLSASSVPRMEKSLADAEGRLAQFEAEDSKVAWVQEPKVREDVMGTLRKQIGELKQLIEEAKNNPGTHNYVVFDDKTIDILNREGKLGPKAPEWLRTARGVWHSPDRQWSIRGPMTDGAYQLYRGGSPEATSFRTPKDAMEYASKEGGGALKYLGAMAAPGAIATGVAAYNQHKAKK